MRITDLPLPTGPAVLEALPVLERALAGGAPIRPVPADDAPAADGSGGPGAGPAADRSDDTDLPDDLAVVVGTSGSTGDPKLAMLGAAALAASAAATHDRLGGPGQWLLALPTHHVAGLQVLARSVHAGTTPIALDPAGMTPFDLVQGAAAMTGERRYTSLVPTQLTRLLDDPLGVEALRRFDAVLVGGAASPPDLLERSRERSVRVVTTYGMSETCGGCVYAGRPLDGVQVVADDDGRLLLGGPVVAHGYLGRPELTDAALRTASDGTRWFATDDLGEVSQHDGRTTVQVLGRADDLITTGGLKLAPRLLEEATLAHVPAVTQALAVGIPDPEWGQAVTLVVVTSPGGPPPGPVPTDGVAQIREMLRPHLPGHALPRRVLVVDALPSRGPGKPDRAAARELVASA